MDDRHQAEVADLAEREQRYGLPAGARKTLAARHQRERRRFRTDELRFGLALLARTYRDRIVAGLDAPAARRAPMPDAPDPFAPLAAIRAAAEALDRNANESLLLLRLFLTLEPLR
jgi:hypothetical protein